jgi:iron-sulfur cluster repair protein YtfE (RIC family)
MSGVRFIHKAMRAEAERIEELAQAPAFERAELAQLVEHLDFVNQVHTSGEEAFVFPLLDAKAGRQSAAYLLDHEEDKRVFAELRSLLTEPEGDEADRARRLARIRRQTIVLHENLLGHMAREEKVAVPAIEATATFEEQAQCIAGAVSHIPRESMPQLMPWKMRALDPDERVAYLTPMLRDVPPQMHPVVGQWIRSGVSDEDWSDLSRRLPQLAGSAAGGG